MKNHLVAIAFFVLMTFSHFVPSAPAAESCQPVFEAEKKLITTPSHSYTTSTAVNGGKSQISETIMVQGKKYIRGNGNWIDPNVSTAEVLEQEQENENGKSSCQFVRSESVNGKDASLYHMHRETEDFKEDSQIWISKTTGLPLREEQDVNMGGAIGKQHRSARFEYGNIRPPI